MRTKAFTLVELIVVMAAIAILLLLTAPVFGRARLITRRAACVSNLRNVGIALQTYFNVYRSFPSGNLPVALEEALLKGSPVLRCPADPDRSAADSYSHFYTPRWERTQESWRCVIACPKHEIGEVRSATVLYAIGDVRIEALRDAQWNGSVVRPGTSVSGGFLRFADLTTVVPLMTMNATFVTSFAQKNGNCYSIIRAEPGDWGTVISMVVADSRYELATPRAVISSSEGTSWTTTQAGDLGQDSTNLNVFSGQAQFQRSNGIRDDLGPGGNVTY